MINFFVLHKRRSFKRSGSSGRVTVKAFITKSAFTRPLWRHNLAFALDLLTVIVGIESAIAIRFTDTTPSFDKMGTVLVPALCFGCMYALLCRLLDCLRRRGSRKHLFRALQILLLLSMVSAGLFLLDHLSPHIMPSGVVVGAPLLSIMFLGCIKVVPYITGIRGLHPIQVAELLERQVVPLQSEEACRVLKDRVILITGAAGSIGSELCRQLLDYEPELLVALDINETGLFDLAESLRSHPLGNRLQVCINDITNVKNMERLFIEARPSIVFHAAAYKHVPLLENHPDQAIRTNVLATFHLSRLAREHAVAHFVFISTDKAAEPISVLGATKRTGEIVIQALAQLTDCTTRFCAVRFGNVIGSRGSVVPLFSRQIDQGGPITVTDPRATRYFMTIPEACGLVILATALANQGMIYLLDMGEPLRIADLAVRMIKARGLRVGHDIHIIYTGLRPGERLHETLVASYEKLSATQYSKIFRIMTRTGVPSYAVVLEWMQRLDQSLLREDNAHLREHLFEFVRSQELVVA